MNPESEKRNRNRKSSSNKEIYKNGIITYTKRSEITFEKIIRQISSNGACDDFSLEFKRAILLLGVNFEKIPFSKLMKILIRNEKWLIYLVNNGFIFETIDSSISISIGDIFTINKEKYILANIPTDQTFVSLISLSTGNSLTNNVTEVSDNYDITDADDLFHIFGVEDNRDLVVILETRIRRETKINKNKKD